MATRRSLVAGITPDPKVEKEFIRSGQPKSAAAAEPAADATREAKQTAAKTVSRSPLTTRVRSEFATALKRASLERQLKGEVPNTLQDILEEALEPWLRNNGYLK